MDNTLLQILQWYGAGASVIAAGLIAADLGRRITGWAFVLFVTSSVALVGWGFLGRNSAGIGVQNILMLAINLFGVYQYLVRKRDDE